MRIPLIAGNWKMNNTVEESILLAKELVKFTENFDKKVNILICAPFTSLYALNEVVRGTKVRLGAQNMHYEENGAFTGEISATMLKELGVEYVLIGHSERRLLFSEQDDFLNKKMKTALASGLIPVLCVGETLEQRESQNEKTVVKAQLENGLKNISASDMEKVVIAYEPVWAIGTGKTATSAQAEEIICYIRNVIKDLYSESISDNIIIQYGGSVKGSNATEIMAKSNIDGALVGGASLKAEDFIKIIEF